MSTWILFLLLGVGTGALYAALAMGVIVVYRGSGVVNFAIGATAMFPAVVYAELRTSGDLLLPVVGIPNRYGLGDPLGFWPSLVLALAVGALIAALAHTLVFRPLRQAPALTLVIATVGLTIVLQGLAAKSFGTATVRTPEILPDDVVTVFGRPVPVDRFWLAGVVALVGVGLGGVYRFSRFGLATRAASTSEKGATLLGYDSGRIALVNWIIASMMISVIGILLTPLSGVNPFNYSLFVIPALGAALAARLQSFTVAALVGIGIGSFQALAVHMVSQRQVPDFLLAGLDSVVPFVVIVGALVYSGHTLPIRGTFLEHHHVEAPVPARNPLVWLSMVVAGTLIMVFGGPSIRLAGIQSMFTITLLLSLVVLTGYLGQVSLAQLAFAGFGAFWLAHSSEQWGVPFPLAPLLAIAVTTAVGTAIGIPALRIRGIQFAIVTLSAALVFERLVFRSPSFSGPGGLAHVDPPELFGLDLGILGSGNFPNPTFGVILVWLTAGCALLVANLRRGSVGRRFIAVRLNERAAAAAGINVPRTKLLGAATASLLAGVAGVMFAYKSVDFTSAGLEAEEGLQILALAYVGGIGAVSGAVIGGLIAPAGLLVVALSSAEPSVDQFLLAGVGMVIVAVAFPAGLAGVGTRLRAALRRPRRAAPH